LAIAIDIVASGAMAVAMAMAAHTIEAVTTAILDRLVIPSLASAQPCSRICFELTVFWIKASLSEAFVIVIPHRVN